jgi:hypothetical protein
MVSAGFGVPSCACRGKRPRIQPGSISRSVECGSPRLKFHLASQARRKPSGPPIGKPTPRPRKYWFSARRPTSRTRIRLLPGVASELMRCWFDVWTPSTSQPARARPTTVSSLTGRQPRPSSGPPADIAHGRAPKAQVLYRRRRVETPARGDRRPRFPRELTITRAPCKASYLQLRRPSTRAAFISAHSVSSRALVRSVATAAMPRLVTHSM